MIRVKASRSASVILASVAIALGLFTSSARGQESKLPRYTVTEWTVRDGAPSDVGSIEQTTDGFVWLSTGTGLYRFDGISFVRMQAPLYPAIPNELSGGLLAVEGGGLWVGARDRFILLRNGRIEKEHVLSRDLGRAVDVIHDPERGLIALTTKSMLQLSDGGWTRLAPAEVAITDATYFRAFRSSNGSLWVATSAGIYQQMRPKGSYIRRTTSADHGSFSETSDGSVWHHDFSAGLTRFDPTGAVDRWSADRGGSIQAIGASTVLLSSMEGLHVLKLPPRAPPDESNGVPQPIVTEAPDEELSGVEVRDLMLDREGNVWAATFDGLIRLRPNRLVQPRGVEGTGGISAGPDGQMALASYSRGFMLINEQTHHVEELGNNLSFVHRDDRGVVWVGGRGRSGLMRIDKGRVSELPTPVVTPGAYIMAIAIDAEGAPWMSSNPGGLYRWNGKEWIARGGLEALPTNARVISKTSTGDLWFGTTGNRAYRLRNGNVTAYDEQAGVDIGSIRSIATRNENVFIAGADGVAMLDGRRFRRLLSRNESFLGVSSAIATRDGELWVNQANGILRVSRSELSKARLDASYLVEVERFDHRDGLVGGPTQTAPFPTAAEADDGKLWFTAGNVVHIDPRKIARNLIPPITHVMTMDDGQGKHLLDAENRLPLGLRDIIVSYTATSLSDPSLVKFKYRLGNEDVWRDNGNAREVRLNNLEPGSFEFTVKASNGDGIWGEPSDPIRFLVPSHFHERTWFKAFCVVSAVALLFLVLHLRSVQVASRVRERLRERACEREDIARDLHDTLLQGVHGLVLQMQVICNALPKNDPQRPSIEQAMDGADALIREGRERVSDLRLNDLNGDLGSYFRSIGAAFKGAEVTQLVVEECGRPKEMNPLASLEVRRILSEALINALRHAKAATVRLTLDYSDRELLARVHDDGVGIPSSVLAAGGRPGHWGLKSMRERAAQLGGRLEIRSGNGKGTLYELRVPSSVAYARSKSGWRTWLPLINASFR